MTGDIKHPLVLWAQRSSSTNKKKNFIYLTIKVAGIIYSTLNYTITDTTIELKVNAKEENEEREYAFKLDFYAPVIPEVFEKCVTAHSVTFLIFKKDITSKYWPKLSKTTLSYIKTDFSRCTWEDEESEGIDEDGFTATNKDIDGSSREGPKGSLVDQSNKVSHTPGGHSDIACCFNNLGNSHSNRFERTGDLKEINYAISFYQKAIESTPSGHANISGWFNNLGNSYSRRFERAGDLKDINSAISYHRKAVEFTPSGHSDLAIYVCNLGNSYSGCFKHTGDLEDINLAILFHRKAVKSTPSGHANLAARFNNLGNSHSSRFEHTGDLKDINCAISCHQKAVGSTLSGHTDLAVYFCNLGNSYSIRFKHTGDIKDIDLGTFHHRKAVEATPAGHTKLAARFNNLGNSHSSRFECTGDLEDINCAISCHHKAVGSTLSGHADLAVYFCNLGNSYLSRFERAGDLKDINCAISYHQKAIESTPSSHANIPGWFNNLGNSYSRRFERAGDLKDIHCALFYHQKAVESTPSSHAELAVYICNLGNSYSTRFKHTGNLEDIDLAILFHRKALESTPSGHSNLAARFNNLGNSYSRRFQWAGDLQDIDCAISYYQKTVESIPSGHTSLPAVFNNLGKSYSYRFGCTGDLKDIDLAIFHHQEAIKFTPCGHAELAVRLNCLGSSYVNRSIRTAISHLPKAVEFHSPSPATYSYLIENLGTSYLSNFINLASFPDGQHILEIFRHGAKANGPPSVCLLSAKQAATLSLIFDDPSHITDFALGISLLSEVAGLEQTIHRRHANLGGNSGFVGLAVAVALGRNMLDTALEWLEQGRCLVWNQLTQLRTPVDALCLHHPVLADSFILTARELESYGSRSSFPVTLTDKTLKAEIILQGETLRHTTTASEYKKLLDKIRALPDFHDFLQPLKAGSILSSLPPDGPVVIFNFGNGRCDALALRAGYKEPLHIPLEKFSLNQAEKLQKLLHVDILHKREIDNEERGSRRCYDGTMADMSFILRELWCKAVQPVLKALDYMEVPILSNRERIWWCPTGPLAFLPLHAAGIYDETHTPGSCVSDFVVSSYTPTVRSINEKSAASPSSGRNPKLLVMSQPNTPRLLAIPSTKTETEMIAGLVKEADVGVSLLNDCDATTEAVKAEMMSCNWAHFACHGIQNTNEPLESGLCLHDGSLTLLEMMKLRIANPDLAFLSACQTSKGDSNLSEEVVHLAAGMLAAGYRGVVGTMWSISDTYGPQFAAEFYEYLIREKGPGGISSDKAAYALDYATRKVRETLGQGDMAFKTWVPYVHYGY